jgi:predicted O-linked N-acetylglucosamine transferase (SPINDLY family)
MENDLYNTLKTKYTGVKTKSTPKVPKEMIDASEKLKAATRTKLYSKEYKDLITEKRAVNKIESAMQSKQYSNELKQFQAVNKNLGPAIKQAVTRNKYIKARDRYLDKKEQNKLDTMEAQVGYIENVVKKADGIQKQNKAISTLSNAIKLRKARKEFIDAQNTYDPRKHQQNIREKRKEFTRIITTQTTSKQAKDDAKKQFKKTDYVFKRKSNAGRPPKNGAQENEF